MKRAYVIWGSIVLCIGVFAGGAVWLFTQKNPSITLTPLSTLPIAEKPLEKYSIENLAARKYKPSQILFGDAIATTSSYSVMPFSFESDGKKVTGLAHVPMTPLSNKLPVVVQFRGYVDPSMYTLGMGTKHSAEQFASHGFVSLAPDFLGYGGSDKEASDVFESRFETYTTALNLLASLSTISFIDTSKVFLWGHSNGGHIALTVLTILGERASQYPTSVWAPVTEAFPYSILYYTDEADDHGKFLRKELSKFEENYDVDQFTFYNYISRIQAPILFHQGTSDEAVPLKWSNQFVERMKELGKQVTYYIYEGADHNLSQPWNTVMNRDIQFFQSFLK